LYSHEACVFIALQKNSENYNKYLDCMGLHFAPHRANGTLGVKKVKLSSKAKFDHVHQKSWARLVWCHFDTKGHIFDNIVSFYAC